jgi:hypothetical protein|tara:strand:- start:19 stop:312 length:294 start_codon:yes stop_codon:yes gene_type:complete
MSVDFHIRNFNEVWKPGTEVVYEDDAGKECAGVTLSEAFLHHRRGAVIWLVGEPELTRLDRLIPAEQGVTPETEEPPGNRLIAYPATEIEEPADSAP